MHNPSSPQLEDPPNTSMNLDPPPANPLGPSFKQTLLADQMSNLSIKLNYCHLDMTDELSTDSSLDNFIPLTTLDKSRLYSPWKFSLVVKVFERKIGHLTLQ